MFKLSILINESDFLIISCSGNILLFVDSIAHEAMVAYAGSITPKSSRNSLLEMKTLLTFYFVMHPELGLQLSKSNFITIYIHELITVFIQADYYVVVAYRTSLSSDQRWSMT